MLRNISERGNIKSTRAPKSDGLQLEVKPPDLAYADSPTDILNRKERSRIPPAAKAPVVLPAAFLVKKLYKSRTDRVLDGVCGGLAEYFDMDPALMRLIWVLITILGAGFFGIVAYLIAMMIMPAEPSISEKTGNQNISKSENRPEAVSVEPAGKASASQDKEGTVFGHDHEISQYKPEKRPSRAGIWLGILLIGLGVVLLAEKTMGIQLRFWLHHFGPYLLPTGLILLGLWLIIRQKGAHKAR
ncbi:phage shock protein C, PspC [Caldalkalibacillus thermarum TA2.A1]|uniref:Phage shock protein C, PspC n=1 Tax=Caldalkalibacillus thermarum (strain TA2.A1) TaxID=986075 RepID=F5L336_CALTT|nr:PspC domain-containing protein [Caldalkalibacillus thermarum]EGL84247.1 phage shock protein C, PspC [Caldalkalibacillus thermarum TA2.A1]QZT32509.1 PspC domain-containing protein [Caldalkalibacillus thermarum TA2.A1]